jgi:hypothetical protein
VAEKLWRVTADKPYRGKQPGEVFSFDFTPEQKERATSAKKIASASQSDLRKYQEEQQQKADEAAEQARKDAAAAVQQATEQPAPEPEPEPVAQKEETA